MSVSTPIRKGSLELLDCCAATAPINDSPHPMQSRNHKTSVLIVLPLRNLTHERKRLLQEMWAAVQISLNSAVFVSLTFRIIGITPHFRCRRWLGGCTLPRLCCPTPCWTVPRKSVKVLF